MDLKDTGERMIPARHKGHVIYGEHVARYEAVADLVAGRTVLDIACGTGYGSSILSRKAAEVVGVDRSEEAVRYATAHYRAENVSFRLGDCSAIPLDDGSVDVVVSFETIEHIDDHRAFLQQVKRVLRPGGCLVLSTPNDDMFAEGGANHFHVREFRFQDLQSFLHEYFKHLHWFHQDTWLYSAIFAETDFVSETELRLPTIKAVSSPAQEALYFLVVCADEPIALSPQALGVIAQRWSAKEQLQFGENHRHLVRELEATRDALGRALAEREERLAALEADRAQRIQLLESQLAEIQGSQGYRLLRLAQRARARLLPPGTLRDRLLGWGIERLFPR